MRPLYAIAQEINFDWGNKVSPYAKPYLRAMQYLNSIDSNYYEDSADSIVRYFLANANGWRGETARRIKAELRGMLK